MQAKMKSKYQKNSDYAFSGTFSNRKNITMTKFKGNTMLTLVVF